MGAATLVILLSTLFRAWTLRGTWFYVDDFPMLSLAANEPLTGSYLTRSYLGHLMPGGRLFIWVATQVAPSDYTPFVLATLGLFALAGVGMAKLLVNLFGIRWGILPPLVVFSMTAMLSATTLWWAAAVNQSRHWSPSPGARRATSPTCTPGGTVTSSRRRCGSCSGSRSRNWR